MDTYAAIRERNAETLRRYHQQVQEAQREWDRQLASKKLAADGRPRSNGDRTPTATRGPDGSSDSDNKATDGLLRGRASESTWPTVDPNQRLAMAKQQEEEGRRKYLMGIFKDRVQYRKLLIVVGIIDNSKRRHIGYKNWSSDEENLAKDINEGLSDTDSFICIPEDQGHR